jgi:hypothetical protein
VIHRPVLAISDWLRDPNTGPNRYLPDLTLEPEDSDLALEPIKAVFDPFRNPEVLENTPPGRYPALMVTPASPVEVQGEVNQDEQDTDGMDVLIRLVANELRTPKALRKQAYYLHALNLSVSGFFADDAAGQAARQRGNVQIIAALSRSYALAYATIGDAIVTGEYLIRCATRNLEGSL